MKKKGWDRLHSRKEAEENQEANEGSNQEKVHKNTVIGMASRLEMSTPRQTALNVQMTPYFVFINSQIILMSHILNVASARTGFSLFIHA